MLTAIIRSSGETEPLAATLTVLIAAVSEGFIGHAVVVVPVEDTSSATLADATGAAYVVAAGEAAWVAGAAAARGDFLLLLEAGEIPDLQWARAVQHHLLVASQRPALMPREGVVRGTLERLNRLLKPHALGAGLVATRRECQAGRLESRPLRLRAGRQRMLS